MKFPPWWSRPNRRHERALREWRPAELAAKHDERVIEQPTLLQILDEGGRGLVDRLAHAGQQAAHVAVMIPPHLKERDELDATFGKPTGDQRIPREGALAGDVRTVHLEDVRRLVRDVGDVRDRRLHPIPHLVLAHPRQDVRILREACCRPANFPSASSSERRASLEIPSGFFRYSTGSPSERKRTPWWCEGRKPGTPRHLVEGHALTGARGHHDVVG